ncbi:MAG: MFS transporter [Clostridia bacterium]|nr:MFS transporter [Clostridia bacterium]
MNDKLSAKNYIGYTFCDTANNLAFCVMGTYLAIYCTDILGIKGTIVTVIFWIARIWDAINDPIMGTIVQKHKPGKGGKYRPFILWAGFPLAISAVLVYALAGFPKLTSNETVNIIYVAVTYILYGMIYTVLSVPYGSLAMVMTDKDNERSNLSVSRAIGGGFGNIPQLLFPTLVMVGGDDGQQMDGKRLFVAMCIIAVAMMSIYFISYAWTKEKPELILLSSEQVHITSTLKDVIKDRAFVTMSLIGGLVIAVQLYINTANVYLFKDFYEKSGFGTIYLVISYLPMALMIPFANKMIRAWGKKAICVVGFSISSVAALITWLGHFQNIWVYIILAFFVNAGIGFVILEVWAMCGDVVDHQEWVTGKREEATNFAVFTFMRKMGQALAAIVPMLCSFVGYNTDKEFIGKQAPEVIKGMYNVSTFGPFLMIALMLVLILLYPLDKKTTEQMQADLAARRAVELDEKELPEAERLLNSDE